MEDKKIYIKPEAEVINFGKTDIITTSDPTDIGGYDDKDVD